MLNVVHHPLLCPPPPPPPIPKVCLVTELKPLVFSREVLSEVLMLAAVQEHVQSAASVLHQVMARVT